MESNFEKKKSSSRAPSTLTCKAGATASYSLLDSLVFPIGTIWPKRRSDRCFPCCSILVSYLMPLFTPSLESSFSRPPFFLSFSLLSSSPLIHHNHSSLLRSHGNVNVWRRIKSDFPSITRFGFISKCLSSSRLLCLSHGLSYYSAHYHQNKPIKPQPAIYFSLYRELALSSVFVPQLAGCSLAMIRILSLSRRHLPPARSLFSGPNCLK